MSCDKVGDLRPSNWNPRSITDEKLWMLGQSMKEFGDLSGIVVNIRTGRLVGGHQRLKQLDPGWPIEKEPASDATGTVAIGHIDTPWGRFSYREVDWDEKKAKAANIAANKHGGYWDNTKLAEIITEFKPDDGQLDLPLLGFSQLELRALISPDELAVEDDAETDIRGECRAARRIIIILDDDEQSEKILHLLGITDDSPQKVTYYASKMNLAAEQA